MTATNTSKPAKDGTGASFTLEMGAESVSGNIAQKAYLGSPSTEALVEPAQDGTDGTGITPPTGATGIRGWLSGIFNKLNTSISVTGTFFQATQPVSAASLPLPSGAATAAKQPTLGTAGTASADVLSVQGVASMTALKVDGSAVTQPISAASLPLPSGAAAAANQPTAAAQGSTTSGQTGRLMQGAVTTAPPSYTTAQTSPISLTTAGAVRTDSSATTQPVSGTVTANAGTNLNTSALALEAGGNLAAIKTNTTITAAGTAATSGLPVQGMTGGVALPVSSTDGSLLSIGALADVAWTGSGNASAIAALKGIYTAAIGSIPTGSNTIGAVTGPSAAALALDASVNGILNTQGAAIAGVKGPLALTHSRVFAPSYADSTINPLSTDSSGNLRVISASVLLSVTPTVTSNGVYSAGNVIGGKLTFTLSPTVGKIVNARVTSKSVLTTNLNLYLFDVNPTNTTWTDRTAPSINSADLAGLLAIIPLTVPDSKLGTMTIWSQNPLSLQFTGNGSIYGILVGISAFTLTSASTSDFTIKIGVAQ